MTAPAAITITSTELQQLLESSTPPSRSRRANPGRVRLVAGSVVLSAVVGSVAVPQLKWVAAAIGGGLTYAALSNTCAMATALSKLPYNRGATPDAETILTRLGAPNGRKIKPW